MRIKGLRLPLILLSACLALSILLSGQWIFQEYSVRRPLLKEIQAVHGVQDVKLLKEKQVLILEVKLGVVNDLAKTYRLIESSMVKSNSKLKLRLVDKRDEKLSKLWNKSQFAIYEALANGNFTAMSQNIEQLMQSSGLDNWGISIDSQNIYVEMYSDSNYLYEIVPREQKPSTIGGNR